MLESDFKLYPVEDRETISRFLVNKRENNNYAAKGRVHNRAFEPRKPKAEDKKKIETMSAYRTKELGEADIWYIAKKYVTDKMKPPMDVIGRADIPALFYKNLDLRVVPEPDPHPRHADIEGWEVQRMDRLELRKKLANEATLKMK